MSIESMHIIIESALQSSAEKECQNSSTTEVINVAFATSCLSVEVNYAAEIR